MRRVVQVSLFTALASTCILAAQTLQKAATSFDGESNIQYISQPTLCVGGCDAGDWVSYADIEMYEGAAYFTASLASWNAGPGGKIELRLDNPDGILIGALTVEGIGGSWYDFHEQSVQLQGNILSVSNGKHDLYLVFKADNGVSNGICNLQGFWIEFAANPTELWVGDQPSFFIDEEGRIGIGELSGGEYRLAIEGVVGCRELVVTELPWSDFVFEKGYRLQPLSEVRDYIEKEGHLPGMPTEQEVKDNGVNMGVMQAKMLQKIEEMTLHLIRLDRENRTLKHKIREFEQDKSESPSH